jgi:hypothetical protein
MVMLCLYGEKKRNQTGKFSKCNRFDVSIIKSLLKENENLKYSRRSLIRSHLDAQLLDTDYFLLSIELTVIYSKYVKYILKLRIKKFSRVTDW